MKIKQMEEMRAICDGEKSMFCFIRHEGKKISYLYKSGDGEMYTMYTTSIRGKMMETGRLSDGRIIVFAADGRDLVYMIQAAAGEPQFTGIHSWQIEQDYSEIVAVSTATGLSGTRLCLTLSQKESDKLICVDSVWHTSEGVAETADDAETKGTYFLNVYGGDTNLSYIEGNRLKIYVTVYSEETISHYWKTFTYQYADRTLLELGEFVQGNALGICALETNKAQRDILQISYDYRQPFFKLYVLSMKQTVSQYDMAWNHSDYYTLAVSDRKLYHSLMKDGSPDYTLHPVAGEKTCDSVTFFHHGEGVPEALALDKVNQKIYELSWQNDTWVMKETEV